MKKVISFMLAAIIVCSLAITAFAANGPMVKFDASFKVPNAEDTVASVEVTLNGFEADGDKTSLKLDKASFRKQGSENDLASTDKFVAGKYTVIVKCTLDNAPAEEVTYTVNDATAQGEYKEDVLTITGTITVAEPAPTTYTLSYETKGVKTIDSVKLDVGADVVLADAKVEGYKFNGWFADAEFKTPAPSKMPAADTTLYASYTKVYKITFVTGDVQKIDAQWYEVDEAIKMPETKADGYTFLGWYADEEYKTEFKTEKMPEKDITVYGLYAINLTTFSKTLKDTYNEIMSDPENKDIAEALKNISPETFNELAKIMGVEILYSINGKEYNVKNILNFIDEITKQLQADIETGKAADVIITFKPGKDKEQKFTVYNDTGKKEDPTKKDDTSTTVKDDTTSTTKTDDKSTTDKKDNKVPNTGSASTLIPAVFALLASTATAGGVILKKKKEDQ